MTAALEQIAVPEHCASLLDCLCEPKNVRELGEWMIDAIKREEAEVAQNAALFVKLVVEYRQGAAP